MAVYSASRSGVQLQNAQTGNADSTNMIDRGANVRDAGLLLISATAGATPTVTVAIQGSVDGVNWFAVPYSTTAAPTTVVVANLTLTSTAVTQYHLAANYAWRFLKLNMSANTNMTLTSTVWA